MKKIYNQPQTDICHLQIENLMLSVSVNTSGTPTGSGGMHAPERHGDIIPF